jgi:hypothetical protein
MREEIAKLLALGTHRDHLLIAGYRVVELPTHRDDETACVQRRRPSRGLQCPSHAVGLGTAPKQPCVACGALPALDCGGLDKRRVSSLPCSIASIIGSNRRSVGYVQSIRGCGVQCCVDGL